ncbi:MAG TPA: preprotein translocase subunit SecG [Thermodesulfobacteriota bacterium]
MIVALVTVLHVLVGVLLIIVVLLQAGRGADIGAAFGGASQTFFGGRGAATFLAKVTAGAAAVFMVTSLYLAHVSGRPSTSSLLDDMPPAPAASPAAPAAPAASPAEPAPAAPAQPAN